MLVLALDTSSEAVAADVVDLAGGRVNVRGQQRVIDGRGHTERLMPTVAAALREAGARPADLAAIVAGTGPGPFTGLRVGLVTAGALGEALGVPTYGVCSLDAIAAGTNAGDRTLLVATDARRREVYWALYRDGARLRGPEVSRPAEIDTGEATLMAGAGARLHEGELGLVRMPIDHPLPHLLVAAAADRLEQGAPGETLVPLYLRRPDAVPPKAMTR